MSSWSPDQPGPRSPEQIEWTARGILAETIPEGTIQAASTPTAGSANGTLSMVLLPLSRGMVVSNLICLVAAAGIGLTFAKMALFDSLGNFLRATAESSAGFNANANAPHTVALTSSVTIAADGGYYVGFLQYGAGATGATLYRGVSASGSGSQLGSGARKAVSVATQTDIMGNVAVTATLSQTYWFAAS